MLSLEQKELWQVKLPVFEGPLDLLLYLIKRDELDIYDIPIEKITREYLEYLRAMEGMNLEIAGEYLVMAATLLYIKSRMLLPVDQQLPEEEVEEEDPRWELVRQLVEYKKFKEAAEQLGDLGAVREMMFARGDSESFTDSDVSPMRLGEVTAFDLLTALQRVLDRIAQRERTEFIEADRFTVAEKIELITQQLRMRENILFSELFQETMSRPEVVVTFLAILELAKIKQLQLQQSEVFGEIILSRVL
ncbi:MAG: segregation/condensation protein A [Verrucomicrobiae bacterium]|nr:segregation/condensation protein A [Verrucomicrobiae bacterium]